MTSTVFTADRLVGVSIRDINAVAFDLYEGLIRLGLLPKRLINTSGRASYQYYYPQISRAVYDMRPSYQVVLFRLGQLSGMGAVSPTIEDYRRAKAEERLSQWTNLPVKVFEGEHSGAIFLAVAMSGDAMTFLPLAERKEDEEGFEVAAAPVEVAPVSPAVRLPGVVDFFDYASSNPWQSYNDLKLVWGLAESGLLTASLFRTNHILVSGKTDSGKSTFIRSIVAQSLLGELYGDKGRVKLLLIDPESITFNPELFAGLPQIVGRKVYTQEKEILSVLKSLAQEKNRRSDLYNRVPGLPESLADYNREVENAPDRAHWPSLPVILVIVEEASIQAASATGGDEFEALIKEAVQRYRKFGIYLVLAGQRFDSKTLDKSIVQNCPTRFAIGESGPDTLRVLEFEAGYRISKVTPGRGLARVGGRVEEFQGLRIEKRAFVDLINLLRMEAGLGEVGLEYVMDGETNSENEPMSAPEPSSTDPWRKYEDRGPLEPELGQVLELIIAQPGMSARELLQALWASDIKVALSTLHEKWLQELKVRGLIRLGENGRGYWPVLVNTEPD